MDGSQFAEMAEISLSSNQNIGLNPKFNAPAG